MCGKAIDWGDKSCGKKCEAELQSNVSKRNQFKWLMYGAMAVAVSLLILQLTGRV